jgi:hypothetical protein
MGECEATGFGGDDSMSTNIEAFGLKSSYTFKETHIPTSHKRDDIHRILRELVAPTVRDLESEKLINGFHYIVHKEIDLRLSSHDWSQHEARIREVLAAHSISPDLEEFQDCHEMPREQYGGETAVLLCYNNLEFNSRLCLALVELVSHTSDKTIREKQQNLCPHQWVHYLCNQAGYLNLDQVKFELNDALIWLESFTQNSYPMD